MSDEAMEEMILTIIGKAGDAKYCFHEAFSLTRAGKPEAAREKMRSGDRLMTEIHRLQTGLIADELQGTAPAPRLLMVHAQDHLMNAVMLRELLDTLIDMQEEINSLRDARQMRLAQ